MNEKDRLIVSYLRANARDTLTNMSKKTKIPISTIYERIRTNNEGVIQKHTTLIDFNKLGFSTRANIMIKVAKGERDKLRSSLLSCPKINSLYRINNGYDFLIEGVFKHLKEFEEYMETLEQKFDIENKEVHYIIDDLKREEFLSNPELNAQL